MTIPWTPLHAKLHQVLRSRQLLTKHQRILVAVSGGQDSLCLVQLLQDLQPKWDWELAIAHCNHRWRSDADANAAYVKQLAATWTLSYHGLAVPEHSEDTGVEKGSGSMATEAGARAWRYQVLTDTAMTHGYSAIVTGHTASDRAETLLYNLMRGSGADGLQALTWQRDLHPNVNLVRPLLFMTRAETGQFCQDANLQPWFDTTNNDWRYARNRIRQDLLPYLQEHFNPSVEQTLAQTAEILQAEVAHLDAEANTLWQQVVSQPSNSPTPQLPNSLTPHSLTPPPPQCTLNRKLLSSAPLALQRRVMRRCLLERLPKAPNFEHIEKLVALIHAPNRSQTDPFPGGAIAHVDGDWIIISDR